MRILGVDLGSKRIGLAISDKNEVLASPYATLERSGNRGKDYSNIVNLVASLEVELVVVGVPVSMDGTLQKAAQDVLAEVNELRASLDVPVQVWDERLSTRTASHALGQAGLHAHQQRSRIDQAAAAVILQSFLDKRAQGKRQRASGLGI